MKSIYGITRSKLEEYFVKNNDKKFRATQIFEWVYRKRIKSFDEMSNIKKETIELLKQDFYFNDIKIIRKDLLKSIYLNYLMGIKLKLF